MWAGVLRAALSGALVFLVLGLGLIGFGREYAVIRVAGESMHPALHAGDLCLVRRAAPVRVGDMILYREPAHASSVMHRVIGMKADRLVTRGDANPVADFSTLDPSDVVGPAVAVLPFGAVLERWRGARRGDTLHNQSQTARR